MQSTVLHDGRIDDVAETERRAFNAAFYELGLRLYWDQGTYQTLRANPCERDRVRGYLEGAQSHLLRAYDAEFLADAVMRAKQSFPHSSNPRAAGAKPEFNWTEAQRSEVGF